MAESTRKENRQTPAARKAYHTPRVLSREMLEAVAAICSGDGFKDQNTPPPTTCGMIGFKS